MSFNRWHRPMADSTAKLVSCVVFCSAVSVICSRETSGYRLFGQPISGRCGMQNRAWLRHTPCSLGVASPSDRRAWWRKTGDIMRRRLPFLCVLALCLASAPAFAGGPGWKLAGTYPDTGGRAPVAHGGKVLPPGSSPASVLAACSGDIDRMCNGRSGLYAARACLTENKARLSNRCLADLAALPASSVPPCSRSPVCDNRLGPSREQLKRVLWDQTMGYAFDYPFDLPMGGGGASGVAIDSQGHIWVLQRAAAGQPQLFQFDRNYKLVRTVPNDVIGRLEKGHGIKVDPFDNVWITDANLAIAMKFNPEGKLLTTIGVRNKRGDWDEGRGQRLLWQPLDVAF